MEGWVEGVAGRGKKLERGWSTGVPRVFGTWGMRAEEKRGCPGKEAKTEQRVKHRNIEWRTEGGKHFVFIKQQALIQTRRDKRIQLPTFVRTNLLSELANTERNCRFNATDIHVNAKCGRYVLTLRSDAFLCHFNPSSFLLSRLSPWGVVSSSYGFFRSRGGSKRAFPIFLPLPTERNSFPSVGGRRASV